VYELIASGDFFRITFDKYNAEDIAYKRQQITKWRAMVADVVAKNPEYNLSKIAGLLEAHVDFYSLKPHLSARTLGQVYCPTILLVGSSIGAALSYLLEDIEALEKKWGLQ
jgi:hypothetical protein